MSSYKDYKKRALQNPEVKAEYDALQPEYDAFGKIRGCVAGKKTCTGIRDAIKAGICSDANKK